MSDRTPRPAWRDRARPGEVLGLSGVLALFAGVMVLLVTREWLVAVIFFGAAFIVSIVVIATLLLSMPARDPNRPSGH